MKSLYEQLGGTYHMGEDGLLYPDLLPPPEDEPHYGKYGRLRLTYLKEHHEGLYTGLLLAGKLNAHLNEIDETAHARMELMIRQMAQAQGVNEELKAWNQMAWVRAMNNIRSAAEEIIFDELIYA